MPPRHSVSSPSLSTPIAVSTSLPNGLRIASRWIESRPCPTMQWDPIGETIDWKLYADVGRSSAKDNMLVMHCPFLLKCCADFIRAHGQNGVRLVCDATHDMGLQRWKLLALGVLAVHFVDGKWRAHASEPRKRTPNKMRPTQ